MFNTLEVLYVFVNSSTKRFSALHTRLKEIENMLLLKKIAKTRWTSRAESINAVVNSLETLIDFMEEIVSKHSNFDKKTKDSAFSILKNMLSFDFIVSLFFMKNIIYKIKILIQVCEKIEENIIDVMSIIKNMITSIRKIRNSDDEINALIESAELFAKKLGIVPEHDFQKHHHRRKLPRRLDSNSGNEECFNLKSFYRFF